MTTPRIRNMNNKEKKRKLSAYKKALPIQKKILKLLIKEYDLNKQKVPSPLKHKSFQILRTQINEYELKIHTSKILIKQYGDSSK